MEKQVAVDSFEREMYSAMSEGKPLKRYMKTILGKVYVTTLNPFDNGKPQPIELYGEPRPGNSRAIVEIWSSKEDTFFQKVNQSHFKAGNLRLLEDQDIVKVADEPKSPNEISDEMITEILNKPFMALKNQLNKFTSPAPVYRFLLKAEELEKSEKITDVIKARQAELEFGSTEEDEPEAK